MRHNNVSQEGVLALTLSLSQSLSLHRQTSNISSNQTADKQFIKNICAITHRIAALYLHPDAQQIPDKQTKSAHPSTRLDRTISWTLVRSSKQRRGSKKKKESDRETVITWKNNNELEYDLCWLVLNDLRYDNTVNWFVNLTHLHCCEKDRTRFNAYKYWRLLMIMFSFHQLAVPFCFSWFVACLFIYFLTFFLFFVKGRKKNSEPFSGQEDPRYFDAL